MANAHRKTTCWIAALLLAWALAMGAVAETAVSEIIYLYLPACESCARAVAALDALPETVTVARGGEEIESPVTVTRVDISADPARADALFDAYGVPEDDRIAPCVFFGSEYLSGADAIESQLAEKVAAGAALVADGADAPQAEDGAAQPESAEAAGAPEAMTLAGTIGAGLVAGLNTCALSMLLLFLSVLLEAGKRAKLLAACFLAAKFVCYLLIGFVLLDVLQRFNPQWMQPLARYVLTVMGTLLIALNLWDAWQARGERYGRVRNQLPRGMRARLHRAIRALTSRRVLAPAAALLGVVVALGEFLCAGQIYLMRLLAAVQSGAGAQAVNLAAYCAAFVAPSAAICALVLGGRSQARVSAFLAEHMAAVKLATALVMALLIAAAWWM